MSLSDDDSSKLLGKLRRFSEIAIGLPPQIYYQISTPEPYSIELVYFLLQTHVGYVTYPHGAVAIPPLNGN